jgi:hypothetical protein
VEIIKRYQWPSLSAELRKWQDAPTGHEDKPPLHDYQNQSRRAVPAEPKLSGIEREEWAKFVAEREELEKEGR